jgi:hypothetical protein
VTGRIERCGSSRFVETAKRESHLSAAGVSGVGEPDGVELGAELFAQ